MRAKLRSAALTLLLLVLLSSVTALGGAGDGDYYSAVNNESLRPLTKRYTPLMMTDGTLMIPHTLLTDSEIGARTEWSDRQHYLTLSVSGKIITFELGPKIAFDANYTYETSMIRSESSGIVYYYLELDFICRYYGWSYNVIPTDYGWIVRIKTRDGLRSDSLYVLQEQSRLMDYYNALYPPAPSPTPTPTPTPTVPPSVTNPTVRPSPTPTPTPTLPPTARPTPTPTPEPEPPLGVYITFDGTVNEHTRTLLDLLDERGVHAAFFLAEEGLENDPALLRRLTATQMVGLLGPEDSGVSPEELPALFSQQALRMNETLDQLTFTKTWLTRWPELYALTGANAEQAYAPVRDALVLEGFRLWDWTLDASEKPKLAPDALTEWIMDSLPSARNGPAVLRLGMDERTVQTLPLLLNALNDAARYHLRGIGITDRPINRFEDIVKPS